MDTPNLCACGYDRKSPFVYLSPVYGFGGWILLLFGATPRPLRVEYRCTRCKHFFGYTQDPEVLKKIN